VGLVALIKERSLSVILVKHDIKFMLSLAHPLWAPDSPVDFPLRLDSTPGLVNQQQGDNEEVGVALRPASESWRVMIGLYLGFGLTHAPAIRSPNRGRKWTRLQTL
jgi:hypothetical protein